MAAGACGRRPCCREIQRTEEKRYAGGHAGQDPGGVAGPGPADRGVGRDDERKRKEDEQGRGRV
jgi:hypothetical protein